ncbi:MAG: hypothetical protein ACREXM_05320 [Gammaproteobacteria bacterium]
MPPRPAIPGAPGGRRLPGLGALGQATLGDEPGVDPVGLGTHQGGSAPKALTLDGLTTLTVWPASERYSATASQ